MNLKDMFKKTNARAHYISLRHSHPEVPTGLLRKCNKCGAAIIAEDVKNGYYICPKCHGYFRVHAYRRGFSASAISAARRSSPRM